MFISDILDSDKTKTEKRLRERERERVPNILPPMRKPSC